MKVVQQLTCLTLGRPNGPAYSTGELLKTPLQSVDQRSRGQRSRSQEADKRYTRERDILKTD